MKRYILTLLLALTTCTMALAQKNLFVTPIFEGEIIPKNRMVETFVKGETLEKYNLSLFHSIKMNVTNDERLRIWECLSKQINRVENNDMEYGNENGMLAYCILHLPHEVARDERYLCYQCYAASRGGYNITMVYIEGEASMKELKRMFKKK